MQHVNKIAKQSFDYCVVGGGFAGLNAVQAIRRGAPMASILCVDKHLKPGGSWNDFYDFVTLHSAFPFFGVSGHKWHIDDPHVLAPKHDVLEHFGSFVDEQSDNVTFSGETTFLHHKDGAIELQDSSGTFTVNATNIVDATGANFTSNVSARKDPRNDGSSADKEILASELPTIFAQEQRAPRHFIVIGGGKTGMDTCIHIGRQKDQVDELTLIPGRNKYFFVREVLNKRKENISWLEINPAQLLAKSLLDFDGSPESCDQFYQNMLSHDLVHTIGDYEAETSFLGVVSREEKTLVESFCDRIYSNDYFVGLHEENGSTEIKLRSGDNLKTEKEVILVNCRTSFESNTNAFFQDVHPLRPDGTLRFGSLCGFTGNRSGVYFFLRLESGFYHISRAREWILSFNLL